jgi:hypothetical protein
MLNSLFPPAAPSAQSAQADARPVTPLPIINMARFRRLMLVEGWPVDLPRMCVDSAYAYACLALAHTSINDDLRRAALDLFSTYDRNRSAGALAHPLH